MSKYPCNVCINGKIISLKNPIFSMQKEVIVENICNYCQGSETVDWSTYISQSKILQQFCICENYFNSFHPKIEIKLSLHHNHLF